MPKKSFTALLSTCCVALWAVSAGNASATESWQNTNVTVGYTTQSKFDPVFGTGTEDEKLTTVRLEHFGVHEYGDNYFFIRTLTDDYFVWHPIPSRMGKPDDGGKQPDGRTTVQAYRDALAKSADNKAFIDLKAPKPGAQDKTVQYPKMNGALKFEPWGWMPGIGFFVDDIESRFWQQSAVFLVVAIVLLAVLATLVFKMRAVILRQLGGEPDDAAESMKRIANGDLGVNIVVDKNDNDSLMASLKLMQMKLTNLTSAIQENAATLSDQVQAFDQTAKAHSEANSPETLADLLRSVKRLGKTAGILDKSIARIKLCRGPVP